MGGRSFNSCKSKRWSLADFEEWILRFSRYPHAVQLIDLMPPSEAVTTVHQRLISSTAFPAEVGGGIRTTENAG
jgi:phosphoribosylformimino-5-aminoimidazole carboxamide ribonucleotide (ProFAR) isomerase